jgi:hypothetical protein
VSTAPSQNLIPWGFERYFEGAPDSRKHRGLDDFARLMSHPSLDDLQHVRPREPAAPDILSGMRSTLGTANRAPNASHRARRKLGPLRYGLGWHPGATACGSTSRLAKREPCYAMPCLRYGHPTRAPLLHLVRQQRRSAASEVGTRAVESPDGRRGTDPTFGPQSSHRPHPRRRSGSGRYGCDRAPEGLPSLQGGARAKQCILQILRSLGRSKTGLAERRSRSGTAFLSSRTANPSRAYDRARAARRHRKERG